MPQIYLKEERAHQSKTRNLNRRDGVKLLIKIADEFSDYGLLFTKQESSIFVT
jgi:hypothetical protein